MEKTAVPVSGGGPVGATDHGVVVAPEADVQPVRPGAVRVAVTQTAPTAAGTHVGEVTAALVRGHTGALNAVLFTHWPARVPGTDTDQSQRFSPRARTHAHKSQSPAHILADKCP